MSNHESPGLTRRNFLKTTAAAAGATVLAGSVLQGCSSIDTTKDLNPAAEDTFYHSICRGNCQGGCGLKIKVREGKVVQTEANTFPEADSEYQRICIKGLSHPYNIYHPDRIKYPMKRVGERGGGEWEQITWDEAIDTIITTWKKNLEEYGPNSNVAQISGTGNSDAVNWAATYRLVNAMGCPQILTTFDQAFLMWGGYTLGFGASFTANEPIDFKSARTLIFWSSNTAISYIQNWHFCADAIENGAATITIDPIYSVTASKSQKHLPIRPATDAALAMAMCNIVINEDLADWEFIKKSTVGPFLVKETDSSFLRLSDLQKATVGSPEDVICVIDSSGNIDASTLIEDPQLEGTFVIDGMKATTAYSLLLERIKEWTPERAAELCDLPLEDIYYTARLYATQKPASILHGFGYDRYSNAHGACFAISTLAMLTGNLGKHGAMAGMAIFSNNAVNNTKMRSVSAEVAAADADWVASQGISIPPNVFFDVVEKGVFQDQKINIKSLWIVRTNLFGTFPERLAWLKSLKNIDLIVVSELTMNNTAQYADIVLPVTSFFEYEDIVEAGINPFTFISEKAIDPLYECKTEFEIAQLLANGMGLGNILDMSYEEFYNSAFDESPVAEEMGISVEALREKKIMRKIGRASDGGPYIHGEGGIFPSATQRAQFFWENPAPNVDFGQTFDREKEQMPYWEPPIEAWNHSAGGFEKNPLTEKYPVILFNQHTKWRTHSSYCYTSNLRELDKEPYIEISASDAEIRGIASNDIVRVFNDRGSVKVKVRINSGFRPGLANIPHGWQRDQFIDGHYQDLTPKHYTPICVNGCFNDTLVEIEKA